MVMTSSITNVTVLGAGNGGFKLAFDLSNRGFHVALFEHPRFADAINEVKKSGKITAVEKDGDFKVCTWKLITHGLLQHLQ